MIFLKANVYSAFIQNQIQNFRSSNKLNISLLR